MISPVHDAGRDALRGTADSLAATKKPKRGTTRKKHPKKRPKKVPVCTQKDLQTKKSKRRKCRPVKPARAVPKTALPLSTPTAAVPRPSPAGPVAAPPVTTPGSGGFPTAPAAPPTDGLRTYAGPFGVREAYRLLYRAGFGPKPGQAEALAAVGLRAAVDQLMDPGPAQLVGPGPTGKYLVGGKFSPDDRRGHLHLKVLDRQVRSTDQLGERMALVLHDWFGVSEGGADVRYVAGHIDLLRARWRGSFRQLLLDVTQDPGMLQFLSGAENAKDAPNENYAREVMELFALGADRGAYTETDIREMARAFTGFRFDRNDYFGAFNFRFVPDRHDYGPKTVFAGTAHEVSGPMSWQDAIHAIVDHPLHPSFVVRKLWSYFIPTEPTAATQAALETLYRSSGERLGPLVDAILVHPDLHQGPTMVKPPVVFTAGLLRAVGQNIATDAWVARCDEAGQSIGRPPNVAGWNDKAWLNTSSHAARWRIVQGVMDGRLAAAATYAGKTESSADALRRATAFWGDPPLSSDLHGAMARAAEECWSPGTLGDPYGSREGFLASRQNALRLGIAASPDFQVA